MSEINVIHNPEKKQFEAEVDGHLGRTEYMMTGETIIFTHTEVPRELEGQGIAGHIAKVALDYARDNNLLVMPLCPFVAGYIRRHPEYRALLKPGFNV